jgi:hypothetical protein
VAETAPAEILNHRFESPRTSSSEQTPANEAIRPLWTPQSLAFAARLIEQPTSQAGLDQMGTPVTVSAGTEESETQHLLAMAARPVEPPAAEARPNGIHTASIETPSAGNQANRPAWAPHSIALEQRWVEPPATGATGFRTSPTEVPVEPETMPAAAVGTKTQSAASPAAQPVPGHGAPPASQDASRSTPQMAGPEHPEIHASAAQYEDAENLPSPTRVVRRDGPVNLDKAPLAPERDNAPHTAGFEMPLSRAPQAAPLLPAKADEPAMTRLPAMAEPRQAAATTPAHSISVRLSTDQNPAVEVRVMERGGEVRVAVHSPDAATSESVRANLPDLVARLGQKGYETEIWHPPVGPSSSSNHAQRDSGGAFGRQHEQPGGEQQRREQRENRPAWLKEFEASFAPEGTGA